MRVLFCLKPSVGFILSVKRKEHNVCSFAVLVLFSPSDLVGPSGFKYPPGYGQAGKIGCDQEEYDSRIKETWVSIRPLPAVWPGQLLTWSVAQFLRLCTV